MAFVTQDYTAAPGSKPKAPPKPPDFTAPTGPTSTQGPDVTTTNTPTFPGEQSVLAGDPNYQQLLAFDTAASGQDLATMNANIAKMQGYYGSDSDPLSILGRIYGSYQDQNRLISNTLAGHGMINSGETGFQAGRATLAYQRQELDAKMKLQDYIDGLNQAFSAAQRQQKFNEMQAGWTANQNWLNLNPPTSTSTTPPPTITPGTYGTGDTILAYDANGNPITVPSGSTYNPFK